VDRIQSKISDGYQYTQFCEHYCRWRKSFDYCMRRSTAGGEKLFMITPMDCLSSMPPPGNYAYQLFVAVWGAPTILMRKPRCHKHYRSGSSRITMLSNTLVCVPRVMVPDNLKSGVSKACKYEPDLNPTYRDMAEHYGCAVTSATPYRRADKARWKTES